MSDDFVNLIAGYLKSRRQEVDLRTKKALQDEGIKKARAFEEWSSLCDWMKKFCEDANREDGRTTFQLKVTQSQTLEVTADVARVIRFLLSDDASAVRSVAVPVMGPG